MISNLSRCTCIKSITGLAASAPAHLRESGTPRGVEEEAKEEVNPESLPDVHITNCTDCYIYVLVPVRYGKDWPPSLFRAAHHS